MKRNFDIPFFNPDGSPVYNNQLERKQMKVQDAVYESLMFINPKTGGDIKGDAKLKRGLLAKKVMKGGEQDYTLDELKTIEDAVGEAGSIASVAAVFEVLELDKVAEKKPKTTGKKSR